METYVIYFASVVLAIIGFFIHRFFHSVDVIRKTLDDINLKLTAREENMKEIKRDIHEIKEKQKDHSARLYDIEITIAKFKN